MYTKPRLQRNEQSGILQDLEEEEVVEHEWMRREEIGGNRVKEGKAMVCLYEG